MPEKDIEKLIADFHLCWDHFPGPARLIDRSNTILAANEAAARAGFKAGLTCSRVGTPESHRGCRKWKALQEKEPQIDRPSENRIREWLPVDGFPDIVIHFSLTLPAVNESSETTS